MKTASGFDIKEVGTVMDVRKMIARVRGLPSCAYGQPLSFADGAKGMVIGFDRGEVSALLFHEGAEIRAGGEVTARSESLEVPVGDAFIGRVLNGLGEACDDRPEARSEGKRSIFGEAPGITDRAALSRQLETGVKILDAIIPIAKGQRELILGDRVTGKTTLAVDAILNQKGKDVVCIYCCVGRSYNFLLKLTQVLQQRGAFDYTMIVASTADAPAGQQYIAPYTAAAHGEHFMRKGRDVLIVFDDLTKHAWIWREISLLTDRSPGREAYPGDIFYIHSQLVERAAQLSPELGGGSMTFLPIVETQQGDVTGYIPSNLISMTDGQIYLSSDLFQEGFKPAIDLGLSVSRIGSKIQGPAQRALCATLRLDYVRYRELLNVTKIRTAVSKDAQARLRRGEAISEVLRQDKNKPVQIGEAITLFFALHEGALDGIPSDLLRQFKEEFFEHLSSRQAALAARLNQATVLTEDLRLGLNEAIKAFARSRSWPADRREGDAPHE